MTSIELPKPFHPSRKSRQIERGCICIGYLGHPLRQAGVPSMCQVGAGCDAEPIDFLSLLSKRNLRGDGAFGGLGLNGNPKPGAVSEYQWTNGLPFHSINL